MVKVLLSLKWRYFLASLQGSVWAIVGTVFGILYALGILSMWALAAATIGLSDPEHELVTLFLVGIGFLITLLWWLVPLFSQGADATLDPDRLAPYPLSSRDIQLGQLFGGLIGLPGMTTLLASLLTGLLLLSQPLLIPVYLLGAAVGLVITITVSRIISLLAIEINAIPGMRQSLLIVAFLLLLGLGPIIMAAANTLESVSDSLPGIAGVLSWTPLASAWGFVASAYAGSWGISFAQLVLTLLYAGVFWYLWRALLARSMSRIGVSGVSSAREVAPGRIGIFARFPASAYGAIAARTVHTLLRDPRVNLNVIMIPAFYLIFGAFGQITVNDSSYSGISWFVVVFTPVLAGYIFFYLVSYDNSAFSMHVLSPISGKDDRWGRVCGLLLLMLPIVIVGTAFLSYIHGSWHLYPGFVGLSVGLLLISTGVSAYADMLLSIPAPPPGSSPFKTQRQPDGFAKSLANMLVMVVCFIFAIPGGILLVIGVSRENDALLWGGSVVTLLTGVGVLLLGVSMGAKKYDSSAADTLQRVSAFR